MRGRIAVGVVLLGLGVPLLADNVFSSVGVTSRELIPVVKILAKPATDGAITAEVKQVTRGGVELNALDAFAATYDAPHEQLVIIALPGSKDAGEYVVQIEATNAKAKTTQIIAATLTRATPVKVVAPHAQLQFDSSLYVERVINIPWMWIGTSPSEWVLRETGGKAAMAPSVPKVSAPLLAKNSGDLGGLEVTFPSVEKNGDAKATVALTGKKMWLGTANAKLLLQSASLEKNPVYTAVVRSRLSYFWLFATIVAGIGLGWYAKKRLELRGAVLAQKVIAASVVQRALGFEKNIGDAVYRARITALRESLQAKIDSRTATKEEIEKLTPEVEKAVTAIVDEVKTAREAARKHLDEIRAAIGAPERQVSPFNSDVRAAANALDAQKRALDAGEITKPADELEQIEARVIRDVADHIWAFRSSLQRNLAKLKGWSELDKVVEALETKSDLAEPDSLASLKTTLAATHEIGQRLRNDLANDGIEAVYQTIQYAIEKLGENEKLTAALHEINNVRHSDLPRQLDDVANAVQKARDTMTEVILAAYKKAKPDAQDKPDGLDAGDFRKEIQAVVGAQPIPKSAPPGIADEQQELSAVASAKPISPTALVPLDGGVQPALTEDQIRRELRLLNKQRDLLYGAMIVVGGFIIFHGSFIGTLEDLAAAFLWGFSVDLSAATLSTYAAPLLARKPFP